MLFDTIRQRLAATGALAFMVSPVVAILSYDQRWVSYQLYRRYTVAWALILLVALIAVAIAAIWRIPKKGER